MLNEVSVSSKKSFHPADLFLKQVQSYNYFLKLQSRNSKILQIILIFAFFKPQMLNLTIFPAV